MYLRFFASCTIIGKLVNFHGARRHIVGFFRIMIISFIVCNQTKIIRSYYYVDFRNCREMQKYSRLKIEASVAFHTKYFFLLIRSM